ncbi:hypothetical protein C6T66_16840 [Burkholderia multivorans]|uniref:Uncharacterized protein n=1 Tax=Burkholderia multivorans TaxID=87883 RepID=A0A8E2RTQ4_9BURK|nr:hypothetical protein C6P76_14370 [Burkholderia multivorans]PRF21042.1 hypothetical protein C6P98_19870 [Burkholderia multivorans]PRG85514.1 hypothetical protein C6T66_16840 [Burkholderia multivorans]
MPARTAGNGTGGVFRKQNAPGKTHGLIVADSVERAVRREKTTTTASAVAVALHRRREAWERAGWPTPVRVRRQRAAIATS